MAAAVQDTPFVPVYRAEYVEQHSRPSVGFRLILAIPHLILVYFGAVISLFVAIAGWFAALVLGRLPEGIGRFLGQFLLYSSRVNAYLYLVTDRYPPFKFEADYPVDIELAPGRLNRLAVLFRIILVIPAGLLNGLAAGGWSVAALVIWLVVLITGRMPRALFEASVAVLRFGMRMFAYWLMLTSAYPSGLFGDGAETPFAPTAPDLPPPSEVPTPPEAAPPPPPIPATDVGAPVVETRSSGLLVLSDGARRLLILFLVLGVLNWGGLGVLRATRVNNVLDATEAGTSLRNAYVAFAARVTFFSSSLDRCASDSDPLACEQSAERELLNGLVSFDSKLAPIDFPDEAGDDVTALRDASSRLRASLDALIAATSNEEYLQRVGAFQQAASAFDNSVTGLSVELNRIATES